jgi:hypothetical protein
MSNATSNRFRLAYAPEATYAGSLSGAALKTLRHNEESLGLNKNTAFSGEMEANGNRRQVIDISRASSGSITSELSYTDFLVLLIAALGTTSGAGAADTPEEGTTRYTNGVAMPSYYFEKQFTDNGVFAGFPGSCINEITLDVNAKAIATLQFGIVGQKGTKEAVTRGTGSVTAPATDSIMRSGLNVAALQIDDTAIAAAVQRVQLKVTRNLRPTDDVRANAPTGFNPGAFEVSGTINAYFPDASLYDDFVNHTGRSLRITIGNEAGSFSFYVPSFKFTDGTPKNPGQNQDIMLELPFMGEMGAGGYTLALDVTPVVP